MNPGIVERDTRGIQTGFVTSLYICYNTGQNNAGTSLITIGSYPVLSYMIFGIGIKNRQLLVLEKFEQRIRADNVIGISFGLRLGFIHDFYI